MGTQPIRVELKILKILLSKYTPVIRLMPHINLPKKRGIKCNCGIKCKLAEKNTEIFFENIFFLIFLGVSRATFRCFGIMISQSSKLKMPGKKVNLIIKNG